MSFLDRIRELNAHDLSKFIPFFAGEAQIGWIARARVPDLSPYSDVLAVQGDRIALDARLAEAPARTRAMAGVARALRARGVISRWRDEPYAVVPIADKTLASPPLFAIERAAVPFFGIRAFGVHMNGYVRSPRGLALWIARRSPKSDVHPGKRDNMVAGGQPAFLSVFDNLAKEAAEEANIGADLMGRARSEGYISYCVNTLEGLSTATMFVFDLELPKEFVPENTDGEIAGFDLIPVREVMDLVAGSHEFKPNSNLVILDFAIRHGVIAPDDPEFEPLHSGLRR
ncbi:MAG: DUF4743 domain-containing protein [Alphaproteobacteria bacterium]